MNDSTSTAISVAPGPCAPPRAIIPRGPEQLPGESREEYWRRIAAEARLDPEYAALIGAPMREPGERLPREPEENPEWEHFGIRGHVAQLLFARGLKRKAVRFANCGRLGRPGFARAIRSSTGFSANTVAR